MSRSSRNRKLTRQPVPSKPGRSKVGSESGKGSSGVDPSGVDPSGVDPSRAAKAEQAAADLLARFRDGDRGAFQLIVGEYQARLVQFFYRLCWDRDRAEDLTQELFLKLLRGAARYEPQGKLSTFVFRVATNLWIDRYRSARSRGRLYSLDQVMMDTGEPSMERPSSHGETSTSPADRMIDAEEKDRLRSALCRLTEPHRLVFELAIYQELPYAEIGRILDIPVGTVKSRMHNSVRSLRECLNEDQRGSDAGGSRPGGSFRRGGCVG